MFHNRRCFVLPEANDWAILLSGNMTLHILVEWSDRRNGKLCSAINVTKKISARMTWSACDGLSWQKAVAIGARIDSCFAFSWCRCGARPRSGHHAPATEKSILQVLQYAWELPLRLTDGPQSWCHLQGRLRRIGPRSAFC
jgi:hypothetical protein